MMTKETFVLGIKMSNSEDEEVKTDHDLLISLSKDMSWLKQIMSNHLKHHWAITIIALGAACTGFGSLILYIITRN